MTEIVLESPLDTYTSSLTESYKIASGFDPTIILSITVFVLRFITETVPDKESAT